MISYNHNYNKNKRMNSISGYLRKKKRSFILIGNTNKRWFELDFIKRIFCYKNVKESLNYLEKIEFQDIKDYYFFLNTKKNICDYKYGIKINTTKRSFILYVKTEEEKKMWESGFKKMIEIIREFPSFEKEKVYRIYTEGNDDSNYIKIGHIRNQTESNLDSRKTCIESKNNNDNNVNNHIQYRNSITTYHEEFNGKNKRRKRIISYDS